MVATQVPSLVATVSRIVVVAGSDALSVCLNTVAVLFLVEIDNFFYEYGVGVRGQAHLNRHARPQCDAAFLDAVDRSRVAHAALFAVAICAAVGLHTVGLHGSVEVEWWLAFAASLKPAREPNGAAPSRCAVRYVERTLSRTCHPPHSRRKFW